MKRARGERRRSEREGEAGGWRGGGGEGECGSQSEKEKGLGGVWFGDGEEEGLKGLRGLMRDKRWELTMGR